MRSLQSQKKTFTLIEVLTAFMLLVFCIAGVLASFVNTFFLLDLSRDMTTAQNSVRAKMEEIKKERFENLTAFNGTTFDLNGFAAGSSKARIEVTDVSGYSQLKQIRIVASVKSRKRIVGEDLNLDGQLNTGEDRNSNGRLDSPVEIVTLMTQ